MNAMLNMLKALGFDPDAMKEQAKNLYDRFVALEQKVEGVSDERLTAAEAEIERLKEHLGLHDQEPVQVQPVAVLNAPADQHQNTEQTNG